MNDIDLVANLTLKLVLELTCLSVILPLARPGFVAHLREEEARAHRLPRPATRIRTLLEESAALVARDCFALRACVGFDGDLVTNDAIELCQRYFTDFDHKLIYKKRPKGFWGFGEIGRAHV